VVQPRDRRTRAAKHIDIRKHFAHETIQNRKMRQVRSGWTRTPASLPTSSPSPCSCRSSSLAERGYPLGRVEESFRRKNLETQDGAGSGQSRGCYDVCCGHWTPRDRATSALRKDVCEQGIYKARLGSIVRVWRPVDPDPKDEWFWPDVRSLGSCP
jgi:hypothetical protein